MEMGSSRIAARTLPCHAHRAENLPVAEVKRVAPLRHEPAAAQPMAQGGSLPFIGFRVWGLGFRGSSGLRRTGEPASEVGTEA